MSEENKIKDEMKIPEHCSTNGEIAEGFGKVELLRSLIFVAVGLIVGIGALIYTKELISLVLSVVVGAFVGYIFCKKDRYSRSSIVDSLIDMHKFSKSQKLYEFKRNKEY